MAALSIRGSTPAVLPILRYKFLETLDSETIPSTVTRNTLSPSIILKGALIGKLSGKQINARVLLDSGAEGLMINERFAQKHKLTLSRLVHPFPATNVDGSKNSHGLIQFTTIQRLRLLDQDSTSHQEEAEFYVTNIGDVDIIIGTDWL